MSNGLNKLTDAAVQVDLLRKELERNQEEIAVKNIRVEAVSDVAELLNKISILSRIHDLYPTTRNIIQHSQVLVDVNEKKREAESVKTKVQVTKDEAETILKVIAKEKAAAEQKLKAAEPALLEAEAALQVSHDR